MIVIKFYTSALDRQFPWPCWFTSVVKFSQSFRVSKLAVGPWPISYVKFFFFFTFLVNQDSLVDYSTSLVTHLCLISSFLIGCCCVLQWEEGDHTHWFPLGFCGRNRAQPCPAGSPTSKKQKIPGGAAVPLYCNITIYIISYPAALQCKVRLYDNIHSMSYHILCNLLKLCHACKWNMS